MIEKALGINYFEKGSLPISIRKVNRKLGLSHDHDLTETMHYHDFTEIIIVINGNSSHLVEGNEYFVSAGDIFVLQGFQSHAFKDAKDLEIVNIMFDTKADSKMLDTSTFKSIPGYNALFLLEPQYRKNHHFNHLLRLNRSDMAKIEFVINTMFFEQKSKELGYEIVIKNKLEELIVYLSREYSKLKSREAISLIRIGSVIEYLEANFCDEINLVKLAEMCHMSLRNFQRVFKKATGQSPIDFLIHIRLQKSKLLLRESDLQITDIAYKSGFNEYNYYSRKFKKSMGVTPLKYRMRFKPVC